MPITLKLVLILTAVMAAYFDLRVRRIPNWLNVTGVALGFILNTYFDGLHGLISAGGGMLSALCVYIPLYALKGMGAGDVKLMAAIGAIVGPSNWLNIFLATALLGGAASVILILARRKVAQTLHNISVILTQLTKGRAPSESDSSLSIHHSQSLKMPHGAIIATGVIAFLIFRWNG